MNGLSIALAVVLPTLLGVILWQLVLGRARTVGAWCAALGAGYLIGMVGWGWAIGRLPAIATPMIFDTAAPWLAVVAALTGILLWRRGRTLVSPLPTPTPSARLERWLLVAIVFFIVAEGVVLSLQAVALPTLTWDAWNAWLAKSKAWYFAGSLLPAAEFDAWLARPAGESIAVTAAHYPEALPRLGVWMASASGGWNESAIHLLWPGAWMALGLACFGYLRIGGAAPLAAALSSAALLSLPLVTAHAALAGYADLWLAGMVLLAGFHLQRWSQERRISDAVMLLLALALLPAIKLEGSVWLLCFAAAAGLMWLPPAWRVGMVALATAVLLTGLALGGWTLPVPGLGLVGLRWGEIDIPGLGAMSLAWRPVLDEVLQALFLLSNWSLLWYLAPAVLLLHGRTLRASASRQSLAWFLGFAYLFLFFLFFFTDASRWAENFTSVNRVLMHVVPLTVVLLTQLVLAAREAPDKAD